MQVWLQAVEEVLQVLGQDGLHQVPCPSWHYQDQGNHAQPSGGDLPQQLPLSEALTKCYDLRSASLSSSVVCVSMCTVLGQLRANRQRSFECYSSCASAVPKGKALLSDTPPCSCLTAAPILINSAEKDLHE